MNGNLLHRTKDVNHPKSHSKLCRQSGENFFSFSRMSVNCPSAHVWMVNPGAQVKLKKYHYPNSNCKLSIQSGTNYFISNALILISRLSFGNAASKKLVKVHSISAQSILKQECAKAPLRLIFEKN